MAALLALGFGRGARAATLTVVNTNDSGAGSLRQAIADAVPGDTIDFNAGLSGQTITLTTGELGISKNLTIIGPTGGVTVSGNNASRIFNVGVGPTVYISYLTLSNGYAGSYGGGISNFGTLNLTNVTVSGNNGLGFINGGGIYNNGTLNAANTTVSDNKAGHGGGIFNDSSGTVSLTNVTVSGNSAGGLGGGILNVYGTSATRLTLTNVTISGNSASSTYGGGGGGIFADGHGTVKLANSIVAGQTRGADCGTVFGNFVSLGYNLDTDGSCNLTATGDLPNANPLLGSLALNSPGTAQTHALQPGSPAVDHIPSGVNGCGTTVSTDQRDVSHPHGSGCDIGAYELVPATPTPSLEPVGGTVALPISGSGLPQTVATTRGSSNLPIALTGGSVLAVLLGGLYVRKHWLR